MQEHREGGAAGADWLCLISRAIRPLAVLLNRRARHRTIKEIAEIGGIDNSYVSRMVNLTTVAPDIVAAILSEPLPPELTELWEEQRERMRRSIAAR